VVHIITAIIGHLTGHAARAQNTKTNDGVYAATFIEAISSSADELAEILSRNWEHLNNGKMGWGYVKQQTPNLDEKYPYYEAKRPIEPRMRASTDCRGKGRKLQPVHMVNLYYELKFLLENIAFMTHMCEVVGEGDDQEPAMSMNDDDVQVTTFKEGAVCTYYTADKTSPNETLDKFVRDLYTWTVTMCGSLGKQMVTKAAEARNRFNTETPRGVVKF